MDNFEPLSWVTFKFKSIPEKLIQVPVLTDEDPFEFIEEDALELYAEETAQETEYTVLESDDTDPAVINVTAEEVLDWVSAHCDMDKDCLKIDINLWMKQIIMWQVPESTWTTEGKK